LISSELIAIRSFSNVKGYAGNHYLRPDHCRHCIRYAPAKRMPACPYTPNIFKCFPGEAVLFRNKENVETVYAVLACLCLTACGGSASDPSAYTATKPGAGSTVFSAEVTAAQATIRYAQYQASATSNWTLPVVSATVNFNPASKTGTIQFPLMERTELVSTTDAYATVAWTGPLTAGAYRFNGNLLMGCNPSASSAEASQVFASSSLERLQDAQPLDALHGITFDLFDCSLLQQSKAETLKINADGTLSMSITKSVATENQMIDMLNPEKWGGALIDGNYYGGHAFRYGINGVNKYAIVLQKRTTSANAVSVYHYLLAVQR
jgi:hypothetical protein